MSCVTVALHRRIRQGRSERARLVSSGTGVTDELCVSPRDAEGTSVSTFAHVVGYGAAVIRTCVYRHATRTCSRTSRRTSARLHSRVYIEPYQQYTARVMGLCLARCCVGDTLDQMNAQTRALGGNPNVTAKGGFGMGAGLAGAIMVRAVTRRDRVTIEASLQ